MRIDIPVFDGVDEMDVVGPFEVLRNAAQAGANFETTIVTRVPTEFVTGGHGLRFAPEGVFATGADLVLVPGGAWNARGEVGAWGEVQRGDWLPLLASAAEQGSMMGSVCTGAMLLAHAGVIGDRRAATHHSARNDLAALGATVVDERVVDDGDLITAGGVSSGIDLGLWLVERFDSASLAEAIATAMEYNRARPTTAP